MINFEFQNKTKIIFGKWTENNVGTELKSLNAKKVLIHYWSDRIKKNGLFDMVTTALNKENISFVELWWVVANPRLSKVKEGIKRVKEENVDFILAIGGGSVIDSAKAIGIGSKYDGDVWDFFEGKTSFVETISVWTILTIPAAGSESSNGSVITDEDNKLKRAFGHPGMQPQFSILNPEFTITLPRYQTACGIVDMLAHTFERFFVDLDNVSVTDNLCLAHMKSIIKNAKLLIKDPDNYDLRSEIMLAGYIAHNSWLNVGRWRGDRASHMIEHELSAEYDIAHGAGLAIIFPAWMKYVYKRNINKFSLLAKEVFGIETEWEAWVLEMIKQLESFYKEMEMPIQMKDLDIIDPDIEQLAKKATNNWELGNLTTLKKEDVIEIYKLAL